jgi:tetratricopeptide (TPR) repeat protein
VRARLAQAYFAKGDLNRARAFLSAETAGDSPSLLLTLAELELQAGRYQEGRDAVGKALRLDPSTRETVVALGCRLAESSPEAGYPCIDAVADVALAEQDYAAAAAALHEFVTRVRYHVVALMRLVDICVDGGLEATMYEAQAQLSDAYLEVGRGLEARIISEDLVAREPWNRANIERFRRALVMLGEADPDAIIAERLSGESPFLATDKLDLNEGLSFDEPEPERAAAEQPGAGRSERSPAPPIEEEIDLDAVLEEEAAAAASPAAQAQSLDQVFKDMRDEAGRSSAEEAAAEQYRLALTYRELGMTEDAVKALEAAARSPRQRFDAGSLLGRLYIESGELPKAVEWFERASEAPAPTPDASRALLYDLAETLEQIGEQARALAVYVELEAESGGYRDVAHRIERLSKVQAKG